MSNAWRIYLAHRPNWIYFSILGLGFLRKFHLWHHYKNEAHWYGITSPVADWVFRSWKNPHDVTPSELALRNRGRI